MKKTFKAIRTLLAIILLLVVLAVLGVGLFADNAIKTAIEAAGTETLQVKVGVTKAKLSFLSGSLALQSVTIGNPPGYQHKNLLQLDSAQTEVRAKSLLEEVVKIKALKLDGIELVLEQKGLNNNLQEIIKSLPDQSEQPVDKELQIELLEMTDITVKAKLLPIPGKIDTIPLKLSPIRLTNLGTDQKMDVAGLTAKILLAIAGGIAEQGTGVLPDNLVNSLGSALGKTTDLGIKLLETGVEGSGGLIKATEELGKGLGKGIQNLLRPKKEEQQDK